MTDLPAGYKDEAEFLTEARERFQEAMDADRENRDEAITDLEFFAGEQWEAGDVEAREGRPCLTINQLPQFVAQIVGDIRINRPGIKVRPAEDADKDLAEVREGIIRGIEQDSDAQGVYANAGQSQVACGIGNFRLVLEYAKDDAFDRDIRIKRVDNPFGVVWDPFLTEPTGKDARYAFVHDDIPLSVFKKTWPDQAPAEADLGSDDLQANGWLSKDAVRVTEYWLVKETPAEIAMTQDGRVFWITRDTTPDELAQIGRNARGEPLRRKTTRRTVCMYLITGHKILEGPVEHPISRIPIFRVPGWEVNIKGKVRRWGLVRFAKDPQRLKNFWRSVAAEKLALAPRQQWLIHESAEGQADELREAAKNGDSVLVYRGQQKPERVDPPPVEVALLQEAQLNAQDMKDVTGLHDASLGIQSNETSGRAILARQREGDVASYIYHDNLKSAIAECGRVCNEYIPAVYDTTREIRVLGADETQKVIRVNDPGDPESVDLAKGKYDIVVETGPSFSTKRVEAAESMREFAQVAPQVMAVAGDLFARAQDWPLADEIGERIKRSLPPQLTADPNDPQPMPPPDPAQQQQAQMAQMAAQFDLRTKEAQARKAEADAARAEAEAAKAEAEAHVIAANYAQHGALEAPAAAPMAEPVDPVLQDAERRQALARAAREHIGAESDLLDLQAKPHKLAAEIEQARNPPEPAPVETY